jgi:hypothetical protein
MHEPTVPAEASRQMAERRAGVYYVLGQEPCPDCDWTPCACDDLYERYRWEFDHDEY